MAKKYEIQFRSVEGKWFWSERQFPTERQAKKHADEMVSKHPKVVTDYIIAWS